MIVCRQEVDNCLISIIVKESNIGKISSNGNMIMNNQNSISQPSIIQPNFNQQNYLQPNYQYGQSMMYQQPMMPMYVPYGYPGMPMPVYNPQFLMNQPPINNYNRNILNNDYSNQNMANQEINTSKRANSSKNREGNYSNVSNNELKRRHTNNDGSYKPYTLKDYKQIASTKIVMGSLGPNIGSKEWEEKQRKMKKMEEYSSSVSKNKIILKVKKEEPSQLFEKEKQDKIENSVRTKAYEYARLIRPKSKNHFNSEDLPNVTENIHVDNSRYNINNNNTSELDVMRKKRENFKFQIDEIKESLLK
jgi:hypothetical protein